MRRPTLGTALWVAVAALLPLAFALGSLHRGHHGDQAIFRSWYDALRGAPSHMYVTARQDTEYPVLGVAVAVAPGFVAPAGAFGAAMKLLLVPWNALLILAFGGAARALRLPRPRATAVLFYLLPVTWVCAMYFGQIDGVVAALQLVVAWAGATVLEKAHGERPVSAVHFVVGVLALQASLLTKQLAVLAAPGLIALLLLGLLGWHRAGHRRAAWIGLAGLVSSFAVLRLPDAFLTLPAGYHSHLALVFLGTGPSHSDMIGNAPGIFAFAHLAPDASSLDSRVLGMPAQSLGHRLFGVFAIVVTALFVRAVVRMLERREPQASLLARAALLYAGLCHLGVGLLIAGAHERHLFNAFPLLILGLGGASFARGVKLVAWVAGAVYGVFVLSTIEWDAFAPVAILRESRLSAALSLVLLGVGMIEMMMRGRASEQQRLARPVPHQARDFGVFMLIALSLVSVVAFRRGVTLPVAIVPAACGVLLSVFAIVRPAIVSPLAEAWADLGYLLGRVTTPIVLAIVFAAVVVPLGLFMRALGKDVLKLRRDASASTYWVERKRRTFEPADFERLS